MGKLTPSALATLPLAMIAFMANPALAETVTLSSPACNLGIGSAGSCAATISNAAGGSSLTATVTSPFTPGEESNATTALVFSASANASGTLTVAKTITVAFDFTVDRTNLQGDSLFYLVDFGINDSGCIGKDPFCDFVVSDVIPTGSGPYEVTGSQTFSVPAGDLGSEFLTIELADTTSDKTAYNFTSGTITETNGTLGGSIAPTPEPSSLILAGTGMALTGLKRRRNKSA